MLFFNDMDRLSLKLLSPSGLESFAKNIQEAFNNSHEYRKIEDHKGLVEYLKAIRDGDDGSEETFNKYVEVIDIREKVTENSCHNCINSDIWHTKEPCRSCILSKEVYPNWKPKEDTSEQAKKNINDVFGVDGIKHISDRVDSIQANVLEYGNNCVSKLIGLNDKFNALYIDIDKELQSLDTRIDVIESMLKDIQKSLETIEEGVSNTEENVFNAIFNKNPKLNGLDIKQVVIDEGPARPKLKFMDGDLVKISEEDFKNKVWIVRTSEFNKELSCWTYLLMDADDHTILAHEPEYRLVKYEPKFKVGDTVKYKTGHVSYIVTDVKESNYKYFYDLERKFSNSKRNYEITSILESKLEED